MGIDNPGDCQLLAGPAYFVGTNPESWFCAHELLFSPKKSEVGGAIPTPVPINLEESQCRPFYAARKTIRR